jgi:transposase
VISVEAWTTIRYLHAQGLGIRRIAAQLGLARNTVRAALRADRPPKYSRPPRPNPQLVPFAAEIAAMLFEQRFIGSRILRELRRLGYRGGQTALYAYLAALKAERGEGQAVMRYETGPGEQAQFDWSPYQVRLGAAVRRVVVFGLILGYSRRKCYLASLDETQGSVFAALEAAFAHFGGAPRRLLVDNAKVLVADSRPAAFAWNPRFLELCGHYQIEPVACRVRRAQTKGKIERPFFYLEEHFIKGGQFADLADLNRQLARFQAEELDTRVHGTTRESPLARFAAERARLLPLPAARFATSLEEARQVSRDCLVSYGGSRYSVPHRHVGAQVWVRAVLGARLEVYSAPGECVATHALAAAKGSLILDPAHYAGLPQRSPATKASATAAFLARFPDQQPFLDGALAAHPTGPALLVRAVLELAASYPDDALRTAFAAAVAHGCYTLPFVRGVVEQHAARVEPPQRLAVVLAPLPAAPPARPLAVYQRLLAGTTEGGER